MKSMVKILVTIMALSLAEAPVFAAWPAGVAKVTQKVAHLKATYPGAVIAKNSTHDYLNALEAQLSGAAVVLAPVGEVISMVVVGGAGLDLELGGALPPADEVVGGGADGGGADGGGADGGAVEDGGAVGVPAVGAKRKRIEGTCVDFPVLDSRFQVAPTNRAILIANGRFVKAKTDEGVARHKIEAIKWHCTNASGDKGRKKGVTKDFTSGNLAKFTKTFEDATHARRQAEAQNAFLLKRNSLSPFFDGINQQLGALIASDAVLTAADINAFIVMIKEVIGAVRQEDGTMSSGATAELRALMTPYAKYATHLEAYVGELRTALTAGSFAPCAEDLNPVDRQGYAQRVRSFLTINRFLIAAATLAGVFGGLQAGIVLTDVIILDMGVIPFGSIPCTQLFMAGTSALGGAVACGSLASFVTGGADSSLAGAKRKHDGDDKV